MKRSVGVILATIVLVGSGAGVASAARPTGMVAGTFTYRPFDGTAVRSGSIAGVDTPRQKGVWSWQDRSGPITCLVVDGQDAWLAGPGTSGPDTGVFIHVHDGGLGAAGDLATAWGQDPGQPLDELVEWCETQATHVPLFPIDSGSVTVKALPE
ncbi:MAG TPA: hypothetical protein VF119_05025 [Candidatus Limnocylindrales bacterium]